MGPTHVRAFHTLPLVLFSLVHHAVLPARSTPVFPIDRRDLPTASLSPEPLAFIPVSLLGQEEPPTASPSAMETLAYLAESPSPSISPSQSTDAQQEVPEPTPSYSQSWKPSPSSTNTQSKSPSPSQTPWTTASPSTSNSPSLTSTASMSHSASSSPSPTRSVSTSLSFSATPSASSTPSPSPSPSPTPEGLGASPSTSESFIIEVETPSASASPSESPVLQEPPAMSSPSTPVVNRTVVSPSLTSLPTASVSPNAQGSTSDGLGQVQGSTPLQGSSSSACFPENARVTLQSGKTKMMSEVQIGDVVAVGNGRFSPVYFFSHRVPRGQFAFVRVHTDSGKQITISGNHYLLVENRLVAANAITVGDKLRDTNSCTEIVTCIEKHVHETGLYNPHTLDDTIVVDGIVVSVFTTSAYPPLARMLLSPLKLAYRLGFPGPLERFWDDGKPTLARWVVSGTPTMIYAT